MRLPDLDRAIALLREGDDFLLTSHINSDGDGIGGCLALQGLLHQMNKRTAVILNEPPDSHFRFLRGWNQIQQVQDVPGRHFQHVVVVDCPLMQRIGEVASLLTPGAQVLNLDHHPGNELFGSANLVTPEVSSSCEMIYHLARALQLEIDTEIASQLYAGMIFDTGGFRYSLATATTFEVAADLVRRGIRLDHIADRVFGDRTYEEIIQLRQALETLELHFDRRVATMHLTYDQLKPGDPEDVVNYGLLIRGVLVALLLKEVQPGQYRISLRAREGVDVSRVAALFGGGGHTKASGCRMTGTREEIQKKLLEAVGHYLK